MTTQRNNLEIRIARTLPEVEALRGAWMAWPSHRDSDIDFYEMIVGSYPEVLRPHVLSLYRDGRLEAILVGRLEQKKLVFEVGYLRIRWPRVRCLTFVYGPIHGNTSRENIETLVSEAMRSLKRNEADVAKFEFVPVDSALYQLGLEVPGVLSRDTLPAKQGHEIMTVPGSIDEVYRRMSSGRRIETRRRIKKLRSHPGGELRFACYRLESDLDRLFEDAEAIARKTYQRGLGAGFANDSLVRQRLGLAARKGWLRANLLYIGDRPVSFWIGMLYHGSFVSEYMGYDPEFRQWSPGMVLMMHVIEGFCSRSNGDVVQELDFGLGHAEYKAVLCTKSWSEASLYIFSPSLKGLLLKSLRAGTRVVDASARKLLASTSFFPKLKRAWRDRLARKAKPATPPITESVAGSQAQ
jgi:hypothetical protein